MLVRLRNEEERDNWDLHGIHAFLQEGGIYTVIRNKLFTNEKILMMNGFESYPFRPPRVTFDGDDVLQLYVKLSSFENQSMCDDFRNMRKSENLVECLCCTSILCRDNWGVCDTISKIVTEFNMFCDMRKRTQVRFWSRRIASRYLVEDIPLFKYV